MFDFDVTPRDFRSEYFEKEPHLFRGALTGRPFAWPDLDELLRVVPPAAPSMRMFHHGAVPEHQFTGDTAVPGQSRRRLDKLKFYGYLQNGATLVINRLEDYSVVAKRLCLEIGRFAGAQTGGNAYISFKGDGTFGKHWDTHDVFAIQLLGRKRWRIFSPTWPLPLTYQTNDRSGHDCPAEPTLEVTLEEGDVLYLPRGWWHHVVPLDEGSFHYSVGTYAPTLYDYVLWTAGKYLQQEPDIRRAFSRNVDREPLAEALRRLSAALLDAANAADFERDHLRREPLESEFNVKLFLDPQRSTMSADTIVGLTTFHAPTLERGEVWVNGAQLGLDAEARAVVAALRDCTSLGFDTLCARVPDLPRDAVHRAVLNLARHDIVTISQ